MRSRCAAGRFPRSIPATSRPEHRLFPVANCTAIILCIGARADSRRRRAAQRARGDLSIGQRRRPRRTRRAARRRTRCRERTGRAAAVDLSAPIARNVDSANRFVRCYRLHRRRAQGCRRDAQDARPSRAVRQRNDACACRCAPRIPKRSGSKPNRDTSVEAARRGVRAAPGVVFHADGIVTPRDVEGTDRVHVARLRREYEHSNRHFVLWCVGDQLRKGAATNAVQILELLLRTRVGRMTSAVARVAVLKVRRHVGRDARAARSSVRAHSRRARSRIRAGGRRVARWAALPRPVCDRYAAWPNRRQCAAARTRICSWRAAN